MNRPENTYYNACILRDFAAFAKNGVNMLNENADILPQFYDRIESDALGNIIAVDGLRVVIVESVQFLSE